jgi:PAS domain S-box-containing protein
LRGRVELVNRQGLELLGLAEDELLGGDWFDAVVPAPDRLDARRPFARLVSGVEPPRDALETFVRTQGGDDRKLASRTPCCAMTPTIIAVLRSGEDVTERRRAEAQVAYHDALTGLPNRTQLDDQLRTDLARAPALRPRPARSARSTRTTSSSSTTRSVTPPATTSCARPRAASPGSSAAVRSWSAGAATSSCC